LDNSNTTKQSGGQTLVANGSPSNASICYTTDGVTQPGCTNGSPAAVTCVAGPGPQNLPALSANTKVMVQTCLAGFSGTTSSQTYTFTPYTHTISPIDGTVGNFSVADEQVGAFSCSAGACSAAAQHGWITYDATNIYVGVDSVPASPPMTAGQLPPWYVALYFGSGGAGGATEDLPTLAGTANIQRSITAGANIQYALKWNTAGGTPVWYTWVSGAWTPATLPTGVAVGASVANTVEFSIPIAAVGSPTTLYSFGAVLSNVQGASSYEQFRWPGTTNVATSNTTYDEFFDDTLASCLFPNAQKTPF
jgi:hypothetical protein